MRTSIPPFFLMIMFTRILFSFVLALSAIFSYGQDVTSIRFDSSVLDMGNFPSDSCFVTKEFSFTNTGSAKLYFYSSSPDCACVKVALPKKPIAPGKKGSFKVTLDASSKSSGLFTSWVYFHTNTSPDRYRMRLYATKVDVSRGR